MLAWLMVSWAAVVRAPASSAHRQERDARMSQ